MFLKIMTNKEYEEVIEKGIQERQAKIDRFEQKLKEIEDFDNLRRDVRRLEERIRREENRKNRVFLPIIALVTSIVAGVVAVVQLF